jgi:hypothetical protein
VSEAAALRDAARAAFAAEGRLPASDDFSDPAVPALAASITLGSVGPQAVSRYLMLAYDDLYSIEYFQRRERPWWRRNGADASDLLRAARRDHDALVERAALRIEAASFLSQAAAVNPVKPPPTTAKSI